MNDSQIATLIKQLGGALAMMGAHSLLNCSDESGAVLQFGIKGSKAGNKVRITLCADDTYTIDLYRVRGADFQCVKSHDHVYADGLKQVLEMMTGLRTRL